MASPNFSFLFFSLLLDFGGDCEMDCNERVCFQFRGAAIGFGSNLGFQTGSIRSMLTGLAGLAAKLAVWLADLAGGLAKLSG